MLEQLEKEIDGVKFYFGPIKVLKAARLNKRILSTLAPLLGGLGDLDAAANIDMEKLGRGISVALMDLDDTALKDLIEDSLTSVTWVGPNGAQELKGAELDNAFQGRLDLMFRVLVECWRHNKFFPFTLMEEGGSLGQILSSAGLSGAQKKSGLKLAKSGS